MPPANKLKRTLRTGSSKIERIAKVIARAGVCSRREAERRIIDGRVKLDGKVLSNPAITVTTNSQILVDGKVLPTTPLTRLWRYNKPAGLLTTHKDPEGRPTLFDKLPKGLPRVISVGRLDFNSEGLLLITNDGGLARKLELPSTGWRRRYRVRVHGHVDKKTLDELKDGRLVNGVKFGPIKAVLDRQQGSNAWITLSLSEGKNREIRKLMEHFGWPVSRLIRISYGPFQLGNLAKGTVDEVTQKILGEQIGVTTRRESGGANRRR